MTSAPHPIPSFHDGNIVGLSVSKGTATFSLVRSDGTPWRIELEGVRYLRADDFREGNIISCCEAVTKVDPPRNLLEALAGSPHELAAQEYHDKYRLFIDDLAEQIRTGGLTLLVIEPSYGCVFLAITERVMTFEVR